MSDQTILNLLKKVAITHSNECPNHYGRTCDCGLEELNTVLKTTTESTSEQLTDNDINAFLLDGIQSSVVDLGLRLMEQGEHLAKFQIALSESHKEKAIAGLDNQIKKLELNLQLLNKAKLAYKKNNYK